MKLRQIFGKVLVVGLVLLVVAGFASTIGGLLMGTGLILGVAPGVVIADTVTTGAVETAVPGLNKQDISKKVTEMNPARTPLDTILRNIRTAEKIKSQERKFYSIASEPLRDAILGSASGNGLTAGAPAKEYTYASGDGVLVFYLQIANSKAWAVDDTFLIRNVPIRDTGVVGAMSGYATPVTENIMFYVQSVAVDVIGIKPVNGIKGAGANATKYVMPDITSDMVLLKMGNAKTEKAAQTKPYGMLPEPDYNYAQNFMSQVEESLFQRMTDMEVEFHFTDFEKQNLAGMKAKMEMSFLFGAMSKTYNDVTADTRYTTNGITRGITKVLEYGTGGTNRTISKANYVAWCKSLFVGNSGSSQRAVFGGSTLIESLHSVDTVEKQLDAKNTEVVWGIKFNKIVTNFGELLIYHHPLLSHYGFDDNALILDLEHIEKLEFLPLEVTELDLITSGQSKVNASVIQECSMLNMLYPDCHAWVNPKA